MINLVVYKVWPTLKYILEAIIYIIKTPIVSHWAILNFWFADIQLYTNIPGDCEGKSLVKSIVLAYFKLVIFFVIYDVLNSIIVLIARLENSMMTSIGIF